MNAGAFGWQLNDDVAADATPDTVVNPNILMIMVDQLRVPQYWLTASQQIALDALTPNITFIRKNSYNFSNMYVAAQACTPSRSTLLTGLYAPQTGMLATQSVGVPNLDPRFPTFGNALQDIAGYSASNILWFGKWHLSNLNGPTGTVGTDSLPGFGFNGGANAGNVTWPSVNGSPNGTGNEGNNGYLPTAGSATTFACDAALANSFATFWASSAKPARPWFACVSFVNPHDISYYPGFYPPHESVSAGSQGIPQNPYNSGDTLDFLPSASSVPTAILSASPSPWNYETTVQLNSKSTDVTGTINDSANFLQPYFQRNITDAASNLPSGASAPAVLSSAAYKDFLNWYYYMVQLVDAQIGVVLTAALPGYSASGTRNPTTDTAIIFLSDHGDYGGSHGLHAKAGAVYDEALRVPLYVSLPNQGGTFTRYQMCSMVDVFKLVVELALGTSYTWATDSKYKDQYLNGNQSLLSFIGNNSLDETRYFTGSDGNEYAYILSTTDETFIDYKQYTGSNNINCSLRNHAMCLRTKSEEDHSASSSAYTGGKLTLYSKWLLNPPTFTYPIIDGSLSGTDLIVQDYEYYDYLNYQNRNETGNDYATALAGADGHGVTGSGPGAQALLTDMLNALGNMAIQPASGPSTAATGLAATVLTRSLSGVNGIHALSAATKTAITAWYSYVEALLSVCGS